MTWSRAAFAAGVVVVMAVIAGSCSASDRDTDFSQRAVGAGVTTDVPDDTSIVLSCATDPPSCVARASDITMTVTGPVADAIPVRPPAGHQLATIDRDAGVTAVLSDGSVLWLFGDTAARNDDGTVRYFVIGTGAWASAAAPTVTRDAVDPRNGEPVVLATPTSEFPPCPDPAQRQGMWPASAVVEQVGALDRVLIWLENVCLGGDTGSGPVLDGRGMALAEWWYDPADPPSDRPVTATLLSQQLFTERSYGVATVRGAAQDVYAYWCDVPPEPTGEYGPCAVAQTTLGGAADAASYQPWTSKGFDESGTPAPIDLPPGTWMPYPAGGFTVARDPVLDAYVMAYSPWPGSTEVMEVRVAADPLGPWSSPATIHLPGCDDRMGSREFGCYAASAQPAFSSPGHLGIGYYDSSVSSFPTRGAYVVSSVPVTVIG